MSSAAAKPVPRKSIKVTTALESNLADYKPYCVEFLRKHPSSALKAAIHAINCHTADMFLIMMEIISDKYGHNFDEVLQCIKLDERWINALEHPLVKSMSYFDQDELENVVAANERAIAGVKQPASTPTEELEADEPTVKVKRSRKAAPVAEEAAPAPAPAEEEAPKPAKKSSKKKAVVEEVVEAAEPIAEEPPKPAKKSSKKKAAVEEVVEAAEPVSEEAPKPAKKSSKKKEAAAAAAAEDVPNPDIEALTAAVNTISLDADEDATPATKPKTAKKVISKKPSKA